jgi:hypothetical protein
LKLKSHHIVYFFIDKVYEFVDNIDKAYELTNNIIKAYNHADNSNKAYEPVHTSDNDTKSSIINYL